MRAFPFDSKEATKKNRKFVCVNNKRLEEYQLRHILGPDVLQLNEDHFDVHELMKSEKPV